MDRRLSVSVPDMLKVESLVEEEMTYSSTQVLSAYSPRDLPSSVVSLKGRSASLRQAGEDWQWKRQESVRTVSVAESETQVVRGCEATRKSSSDFFQLLQRARLSSDLTEEMAEYPCGGMDLDSSMSSQSFDDQMALEEGNDCLSNLPSPFAYLLTIHLKEGRNLVIRDRCEERWLLSW